jgi:hypothetical protein
MSDLAAFYHTNAPLEFEELAGHLSGIELMSKSTKLGLKDSPEAIRGMVFSVYPGIFRCWGGLQSERSLFF